MTNPFANTSIAENKPARQPLSRPIGVWIVAFSLSLLGLIVLIAICAMVLQLGVAVTLNFFRERGAYSSAFGMTIILGGLISGIGLWRGSRWGWHLALGFC